ncbi:putative transcriptional regulator tpeD [Wolffia australiana]
MECTHSRVYKEMKGINLDQCIITEASGQGGVVKKTLEKTKEIITQFVCLMDSPWAIVDNVGFKIMWKYAAEMTVDPPGSKAIKDVTHKLYGNMKGKLVSLLADVPSVSLIVEAWTADYVWCPLQMSPWAKVDNVGFKIMWKYAAEVIVDPPMSKAIKDVTRKLYGNMKGKLVSLLADVPSVSLTVDAWTAENSCCLLGNTVHWVNNRWELCERVLAIHELVGKHSGENMSAIVLQALEDFGLKTKVSSITTDNASSNGRMVGMLPKELKPINNRFTQDRHVPCAIHMLNIIVQAALQSLRVLVTTSPPKTTNNST